MVNMIYDRKSGYKKKEIEVASNFTPEQEEKIRRAQALRGNRMPLRR